MPVDLLLWILYLVVPVADWGLFSGRPIDVWSAAALAAVCWTWFARRSIGLSRLVALALVLKIALGLTLLVPRGFDARYYANARFADPPERSVEPAGRTFTRIDRRLRFGRAGAPDLPLYFFNELRFNYYRAGEPDKTTLPFSAVWQGYWRVTSDGPQELYLRSPGGAAEIAVGDRFRARTDATDSWRGVVVLPRGLHRLAVAVAVPQGGARQFEAGYVVRGRETPFDAATVMRRPASSTALAIDGTVRAISLLIDALLAIWIAIAFVRAAAGLLGRLRGSLEPLDAIRAVWLLGIAFAFWYAVPIDGRYVDLSGGQDWLTYESHAREIGLGSLLMLHGATMGHADPYYMQPLYGYVLAVCHWLFGDGFFGVYLVQHLGAVLAVVMLWRIGALMLGESAGVVALVTATVVAAVKFVPWCSVLLSETVFVPLISVWALQLLRAVVRGRTRDAAVAGVFGGLSALSRSSTLLAWGPAALLLAASLPRRRRLPLTYVFVAVMAAVVSPAVARNWFAAHRLVPISSEGSIVLFLGNPPPDLPMPAAHRAQYDRLGFDLYTRAVVEYARQRPRAFAAGLWRKLCYTLGWFHALRPDLENSIFYMLVWMLAAVGALAMPWLSPAPSLAAAYLPLAIAASHLVVCVLFLPDVYVDRMIVPIYMLLTPYAAAALHLPLRRLTWFSSPQPSWSPS